MKFILAGVPAVLLCLLIISCTSPKTEESKPTTTDSALTLVAEEPPATEPVETITYTVITDNPAIKGIWVSPHLSNTDFGYRIELTDEKFIASYSGNSFELADIEGSWSYQNQQLILASENDSMVFQIRQVSADSLVLDSVEFRVGQLICDGRRSAGKIQSVWYRDEPIELSQNSIIGEWGSVDGELSFLEDGKYNECCAGGTWKVDVANSGIDLHETWMDAEADLEDHFWIVIAQYKFSVTINHQTVNNNFDRLYFRKVNRDNTPYVKPTVKRHEQESNDKFISFCSIVLCE